MKGSRPQAVEGLFALLSTGPRLERAGCKGLCYLFCLCYSFSGCGVEEVEGTGELTGTVLPAMGPGEPDAENAGDGRGDAGRQPLRQC